MQQIKSLLQKQLQSVLPFTNRTTNSYISQCYRSNTTPSSYSKCIIKRLRFIKTKEDQLSHKLMYVKGKFDQCKRQHRTYEECIEEARERGRRAIERYKGDVEKY